MRNRVFEIVVFLIDYMQGDAARLSDTDDLWATLEAQGYSEDEISSAYSWLLKRFENTPQRYYSDFSTTLSSHRVLTISERNQLTTEAYGFLIKLSNTAVLNDEQFEIIMNRLSAFGPRPVTLDQVKLLASSVVFSDLNEFDAIELFDSDGDHTSFVN
jgi:uncharacterized protein Smg (DUF494 family)